MRLLKVIINKVKLTNFGIYKETTTFDLTVKKDHPVILIGGKNGSGKTTLLAAIKIALYGPATFGFKSINESYKNAIREKINSHAFEKSVGATTSKIELEVVLEDKGNLNVYV